MSMKRVGVFLNQPEMDTRSVGYDPPSEVSIQIENGSYTWDIDNKMEHLKE